MPLPDDRIARPDPGPKGAGENEQERERHARLRAARRQAPEERADYLEEACAGDAGLRTEAEALLAEAGRPGLEPVAVRVLLAREAADFIAAADATRPDDGEMGTGSGPSGARAQAREPALPPGSLLAGRYRIARLLGRGGMGEVYEAEDLELDIPVALKTIRSEAARTPEAVGRFKREVLLSRSVTHPRVCRIYDFGRHTQDGGEVAFLTMELLRGESLEERLRARGRLTTTAALPLVRQMAEALDAAHAAGIVHRDFKSANVMLVGGNGPERAVVTDFGLAWAAVGHEEGATAAAGLLGTPAYMSPEQVRGEPAGPAADLYALGVVLFEMVTGRLPFRSVSPIAAACARLGEDAPSPRSLVSDLDPNWEAAILRLLRREPDERFGRAAELVASLEGASIASARHTLPAERDAFVGRQGELADLERRLGSGARLLTVLGLPGVGKTRLVRRLGWRSLERYPGGVWFCGLSEARSRDDVLSAVATALEVPLGAGDAVAQLGHAIAGRGRCLVLLDNLEQLAEHAEGTLGRWVERAREATFVVTSRERLKLAGEEVLPLEPLPVESDGVELFVERARAQRPDFAVSKTNRETVTEVVRLLDGIPLAIELAAARVRVLAPAQILQRLQDRFALLVGGSGRRHETLAAALDWSWDLLAPREKAALAQASVFAGGFTLEAAEGVLDLGRWPQAPGPAGPVVMDVLQALMDKSLLRSVGVEGTDEPRFGMYVSLQEHAAGKLRKEGAIPDGASGSEAEREAIERHGRHYARDGSEEAIEALYRHGGTARERRLGRELDNLVAACLRAIARGDGAVAAAAYRAAYRVLGLRGPLTTAVELGRAVAAVPTLPSSERGTVLRFLGQAARDSGRSEEVGAHYESALAIFRETGDRRSEAMVLCDQGSLLGHQARPVEAQARYEAALAMFRALGDRRSEGVILGNLGFLHIKQGRVDEAREHFEAALAIHREGGDRLSEGRNLNNLGLLHAKQGRLDAARAHYEASLAIQRDLGSRLGEGRALGYLGSLHQDRGETDEARAHHEAALRIHRETGARPLEGDALISLGQLHREQGRLPEARGHLEAALAIHRETGIRNSEAWALDELGAVATEEGRMDEAQAVLAAALAIFREMRDGLSAGIPLRRLAEVHLELGSLPEARAVLAEAEADLRQVGSPLYLAKLLCVRALLEARSGDLAGARAALAEAEALAAGTGAGEGSELGRKLARARDALP